MKTLSDHPLLIGEILAARQRRLERRERRLAFCIRFEEGLIRLVNVVTLLALAALALVLGALLAAAGFHFLAR